MAASQRSEDGEHRLQSIRSEAAQPTPRRHSLVVPRPVLRADVLTYQLLSVKDPGPSDFSLLGEAYRCWSDVWKETFAELDNARSLPSDDFTRQDEIGGLFHEWECIGTTSFRWLDVANPMYKDDSYFSVWPGEAVEAAAAYGSRICIASSFAVPSHWRRARGGPVKDLLCALVVERFLRSPADTLVGTVRNDRGMNSLCYRLGFVPIALNLRHHGVPVDLVAFHRGRCSRRSLSGALEELVQKLLS